VHLVKVVTDLMIEGVEPCHVEIGFDAEKVFFVLQTPQETVEEIPSIDVAMAGDDDGGVEELTRDVN